MKPSKIQSFLHQIWRPLWSFAKAQGRPWVSGCIPCLFLAIPFAAFGEETHWGITWSQTKGYFFEKNDSVIEGELPEMAKHSRGEVSFKMTLSKLKQSGFCVGLKNKQGGMFYAMFASSGASDGIFLKSYYNVGKFNDYRVIEKNLAIQGEAIEVILRYDTEDPSVRLVIKGQGSTFADSGVLKSNEEGPYPALGELTHVVIQTRPSDKEPTDFTIDDHSQASVITINPPGCLAEIIGITFKPL